MARRKVIKSVLVGFLGTYTSRYSDYRGYWLHGQLPFDVPQYNIDLMGPSCDEDSPLAAAWRLAIRRFTEQVQKSGLNFDFIKEAMLTIRKRPEKTFGSHGDYTTISEGHIVEFRIWVVMDNGRRYLDQRTVFVAAHDPTKERRRHPQDWVV